MMHFVFYCTANSVNTISSVQSSSRNIIIFMLFGNIMVTSDDGYTGLAPKRWRNSGPCRRLMHCLCNIAGCVRCQVLMYRLDEQSRVMCHVCPRHRFVCPKVRCAKVSTALYRSSGSRIQGNVIVRRCFYWKQRFHYCYSLLSYALLSRAPLMTSVAGSSRNVLWREEKSSVPDTLLATNPTAEKRPFSNDVKAFYFPCSSSD